MDLSLGGVPLIAYLLASIRIAAWLLIVPPFSMRTIPSMAKVVLSLGLAFATTSQLRESIMPASVPDLIVTAITQVAIGASMGFVTMMLFSAVAAAGGLIDIFGGFSMAQGFDPLGANMNAVFGTFHQWLATTLLFISGGHLLVLGGLLRSFEFMPIGSGELPHGGVDTLLALFQVFFVTSIQIALPMIAVLFTADLGLALLTKVAPQLNALTVMFPAKIGLTLLLLGLSFPVLPEAIDKLVELAMQASSALVTGGESP